MSTGLTRWTRISVNWTLAAITRMKPIVRRCSIPSGTSTNRFRSHEVADESVSTNAVASDMPKAASRFLDTPMKGHSPRKRVKTKLLTRTVPVRISTMSVMAEALASAHCSETVAISPADSTRVPT